ncbi:MAG: V-type ATP synthase subunit B [Candidatus Loosdrechtia sp.]|uniref:V-type ATP synthase subunit B n=1 Tax=Candidatus Loosdrechtia sp. TaxID=3101272 RepID=UPI003A62CF09|nr:MAG: V-type ATP synthase subunit B [Candidatus Jettenia sp. AMX2]
MNNKVYRKIHKVFGNVITLIAEGISYGELAEVRSRRGLSLAEVIHIEGNLVHLQVFAGNIGVSTKDEVRFLERGMRVSFSDNLFGRIFNGSGQPLDGGPVLFDEMIECKTPSINPARRNMPRRMIHTKIPMIDVFNSLVVSQKLPIFSVSGEEYNPLLARIAMQAEVEVIILGGMGLKYDDFLYFKHEIERSGARKRTIFFVHTAADPIVECLLVPDMALAVGERFALKGRSVLVLLTDMTNYAESLKEIAITMEQIPSNRGYPGDLYSRFAVRYEKAVDFMDAGSVTILAVTTMPGDDITHPVPDNTGYITEGQLYLRNGRIDPFGSLSRLKQLVNKKTRMDHRDLMDAMIRLYAQAKESREKMALGFTMTDWDKKLLQYGELFEDRMMDLSVNLSLWEALDLGWRILADCFVPEEVGIRSDLLKQFWPSSEAEKNSYGADTL